MKSYPVSCSWSLSDSPRSCKDHVGQLGGFPAVCQGSSQIPLAQA